MSTGTCITQYFDAADALHWSDEVSKSEEMIELQECSFYMRSSWLIVQLIGMPLSLWAGCKLKMSSEGLESWCVDMIGEISVQTMHH